MTLQRRLLLLLMLAAPLVWTAGLLFGLRQARIEINELFDTQQILLARQVLVTLPSAALDGGAPRDAGPAAAAAASSSDATAVDLPGAEQDEPGRAQARSIHDSTLGDADLSEFSLAVWDRHDQLLLVDREGVLLPMRRDVLGFVDLPIRGAPWRAYYLDSGPWRIAVAQSRSERDELVWGLVAGQLVPWVLTLPVLLLVMAAAVQQALRPVRTLTRQIEQREAGALAPITVLGLPSDLQPMLDAMNGMLRRIDDAQSRERRFVADAAHELRTPLAALQAQWDAWQLQPDAAGAAGHAPPAIAAGLARLARLVEQLLALSRLDRTGAQTGEMPLDWRALVERLFGELLPLADACGVELACEWPARDAAALPLRGDAELIAALLRNLLDNALRHSPPGRTVRLRLQPDAIEVHDDGPGAAEADLPRLGERFFRAAGQAHIGSGLGLSIAARIAELHGLRLVLSNRPATHESPSGFVARVERAAPLEHAVGEAHG